MNNENTPKNTILSQLMRFIFVTKNGVEQYIYQGQQKTKPYIVSSDQRWIDDKNTRFIFRNEKQTKKHHLQHVGAHYFTVFLQKIKTEIIVKKNSKFFRRNFLCSFLQKIYFYKNRKF